jgi:hypothetical protein
VTFVIGGIGARHVTRKILAKYATIFCKSMGIRNNEGPVLESPSAV